MDIPKYLTSLLEAKAVRQTPMIQTPTASRMKPLRCLYLSEKNAISMVVGI